MPYRLDLARIDAVADALTEASDVAAGIAAQAHVIADGPMADEYARERLSCLVASLNGLLAHVCAQQTRVPWWRPGGVKRYYRRYGGGTYMGSLLSE